MNAPLKEALVASLQAGSTIHAAIAAAMGDVRPLAKEDRNQHGNYNFAGIDAFLDLTRPICAKHGLNILQDEEGFEVFEVASKNGPQKMLLMRFAFTVAKDGETIGPLHRSIMVPASMGSQAFGSAQSYALKQFLRSLFQISTGEKDDIDHHNTGELYAKPANDTPVKPSVAHSALKTALRGFVHEMEGCGTWDDWCELRDSPEKMKLIDEVKTKLPEWWETGIGMPEEFVPLRRRIEVLEANFANQIADVARV